MKGLDTATIVSLITAALAGGAFQALIVWLKDRRRAASEAHRTDVDTKLAYLSTVIEHLDKQATRSQENEERLARELAEERKNSSALRERVRELEEEVYKVSKSARETQDKCDELSHKLRELINDSQDHAA